MANALAVDSDDTTRAEKVLERDSNAVQSTVFPEWKKIGGLLANEQGGPSLVCYALQGLILAASVGEVASSAGGHALSFISGGLFGLGFAAGTLCVTSARIALMPVGEGREAFFRYLTSFSLGPEGHWKQVVEKKRNPFKERAAELAATKEILAPPGLEGTRILRNIESELRLGWTAGGRR